MVHCKKIATTLLIFICFIFQSFSQEWRQGNESPSDNPNFNEIMAQFETYWEGKEIGKGKGYKPMKRWEYQWQNRVNEDGSFPAAGRNLQAFTSYLKTYNPEEQRSSMTSWESLGPSSNTSGYAGTGRINSVGFDPSDSDVVYAGSAGGGVWKTTNGGDSWVPISDYIGSIGVSAIIVDPSNTQTVYIGTGDGDASDNYSIGVLKSMNGGTTWNTTGLNWSTSNTNLIRAMVMHPNDVNTLILASNDGIYRTTNAGVTWTKEQSGNFYDIELKPQANSNTFYASTKTQIYRSTNSGDTWTVEHTLTGTNRIALATSEDEPTYVYALASKSSGSGFKGVYRSTNSGQTFTTQSTSPNLLGWSSTGSDSNGQGWYDLVIAADPNNANSIHVAGVNHWRSTDGGVNWTIKSTWNGTGGVQEVHADKHMLEWQDDNTLWEGNDGGIYKTTNNGTTWTDRTSNLVISQLYKIGVSELDNKVIGGLQDNGTKVRNNSGNWVDEIGGDGMDCAINPANPDVLYGSLYYGDIRRSTNGGSSWSNISNAIPDESGENAAWVTPYVLDPSNPSTIVVGYENVYQSTNQGNSWTKIGDNLTSNTLLYAEIAPSDSDFIYVGRGSQLWRTSDGGTNWSALSGPGNNTAMVKAHPTNPQILYAVRQNYSNGNKVYQSTNGGSSWTNISGTLPNIPANTIAFHDDGEETIYVGMDVGVYYRNNSTSDWVLYNTDLPNVQISEIEIKEQTNEIYIATYGRGVWKNNTVGSSSVCPTPSSIDVTNVTGSSATMSWNETNPAPGEGYEWGYNTTADVPPTTFETSAISVDITGLESGTPYYFFVRAKCSETSNSSWSSAGPFVTEYDCGDDMFDSGGATSDYGNQEDITTVICPSASDEAIKLTFNDFDVEFNWDALYVYNGPSINSPQFSSGAGTTQAGFPAGGYYGTINPGPFTSTDETGCITLRFRSDTYVTELGWDVDISCEILCSDEVMNTNDDGWGSLRRSVLCAQPGTPILFNPSVEFENFSLLSPINIEKEVSIDLGVGKNINLIPLGDGPAFEIMNDAQLELDHITIISGLLNNGGAIINNGILIINNIDIFKNEDNGTAESLILNNGEFYIRGNSNILKE
ncbi:MAG: fibronectin type III domain-containing protein [Saprospiraceae bacterium]|nr:fibronectin type III domain-containing protein [Saprospiraceae bacterium]